MKNNMEKQHTADFQKKFSCIKKTGLFLAGTILVLVTGCVKNDLYNTPHPEKGAVVITTDWMDALSETDIPTTYNLRMDETIKQAEGKVYSYSDLLTPGRHSLLVYNEPQGMTINGTTATVDLREDGTLKPLPEYLFSAKKELDVVQDDTLHVTVSMIRRLCPIVLNLSLTGENAKEIARIDATLSGIISSIDLQNNVTGNENLTVTLDLQQVADKAYGYATGKLKMGCRVVGVNSNEHQLLTVTVTMKDSYKSTIVSDLTDYLKNLNADMKPIELTQTVEALQDGHFNGTITDWIVTDDFEIDAQ